jgi:hypothetical protein
MFKYLEVGDVVCIKSDLSNRKSIPHTDEKLFIITTILNDKKVIDSLANSFDYFAKFKNPDSKEIKLFDPFNYIEFFRHEEIELVDSKRRNLLLEKTNRK